MRTGQALRYKVFQRKRKRRQALPRTAYGQLHMMQMNQLCRNDSDTGGAVCRD
jgi:hypothetical protein